MKNRGGLAILFLAALFLFSAFSLWRGGAFSAVLPLRGEESGKTESSFSSEERKVIELVNLEREKAGLSPLAPEPGSLADASKTRAKEACEAFSHTRPDGRSWSSALEDCGVSFWKAGENLAFGQPTPEEAVAAWMGSEGHRANILGDYTRTAVSCRREDGLLYWCQLFTR